jgi:hypothetical protein
MRRWKAGSLILIAAGFVVLAAIFAPWAYVGSVQRGFGALELRLYEPLVLATVVGGGLIAAGLSRSLWGSFVGLVGAFGCAMVALFIHTYIFQGLLAAAPYLAVGSDPHVTGIGVDMFFAAGLVAGAGGVVAFLQTAPEPEK